MHLSLNGNVTMTRTTSQGHNQLKTWHQQPALKACQTNSSTRKMLAAYSGDDKYRNPSFSGTGAGGASV